MIKLEKIDEPEVLRTHAADWTKTLEDRIAAGETPTEAEKGRYRHPRIKERLLQETNKKCAYCESYLVHISYGDVEHIHPKSDDPMLTFSWNNLTLACDVCNTNKGSYMGVIDPYIRDPAQDFWFLGAMVLPKAGDIEASISERRLRLNRLELVERRAERIRFINEQILLMEQVADLDHKRAIRDDVIRQIESREEYSAYVRAFAEFCLSEEAVLDGDEVGRPE